MNVKLLTKQHLEFLSSKEGCTGSSESTLKSCQNSTLIEITCRGSYVFLFTGARVLIACRDKTKGTSAVRDIRTTTGNDDVHLYIMDLASLESVRQCAKEVLREETRLDILINNAGIFVIVLLKIHVYLKVQKMGSINGWVHQYPHLL